MKKENGDIYVRSPENDPKNGSGYGMFFYKSTNDGKNMERILIDVENHRATIRTNTVDGYFDDWKLVESFNLNY